MKVTESAWACTRRGMAEKGRQERGTKEWGRMGWWCARARSEIEKGQAEEEKGREAVGWLVGLTVLRVAAKQSERRNRARVWVLYQQHQPANGPWLPRGVARLEEA
jgi:hypothetical protein